MVAMERAARYRRPDGAVKRPGLRPGVPAGIVSCRKGGRMAIPIASLPEGTRVKVIRGHLPQDPTVLGRAGVVVSATEYRDQAVGVVLDGESALRYFSPGELEVVAELPLPPERTSAKRLRALP
jgi:hypothetical protein